MDPFDSFIRNSIRRFFSDDDSLSTPLIESGHTGSSLIPGLSTTGPSLGRWPRMKMDVTESDGGYNVVAELPGVQKEDLNVYTDNNLLTIEAERRYERASPESKEGKVHFRECHYGKVQRSITLPRDCDMGKVESTFDNGLLRLHFNKAVPAERRKITL